MNLTLRVTRKRVALLIAAFTLIAAGGAAYATIPNSSNVYTACMLKATGTIRLIDPSLSSNNPMSHCTSFETQITWNQKGPKGDIGAVGATGPTGATGMQGRQGDQGPPGLKGEKGDPGASSLDGQSCTFDGAPGVIRQLVPPSQSDVTHAVGATQMSFYCISADGNETNDSEGAATPITNWAGTIGGQIGTSCGTIFPASDVDWYSAASTALTSVGPPQAGCGNTALTTTTLRYDVYRDGALVAHDVTQYPAPDSTVHSWLFRVSASEPTAYEIVLRRPAQ